MWLLFAFRIDTQLKGSPFERVLLDEYGGVFSNELICQVRESTVLSCISLPIHPSLSHHHFHIIPSSRFLPVLSRMLRFPFILHCSLFCFFCLGCRVCLLCCMLILSLSAFQGCPHYSEREEPFYVVSVPVKNKRTLHESLEAFVAGEMLEADNAYWCAKCQKKVDTLKRCCLKQLPKSLIIQLKRSDKAIETRYSTSIILMLTLKHTAHRCHHFHRFPHSEFDSSIHCVARCLCCLFSS